MDTLHLGHQREAEAGGPHFVQPDRAARRRAGGFERRGLEHVLRRPPLWRDADFAACLGWRRVDGAIAGRRGGGGVPGPRRRGRRHAYVGDAVALAPGADECGGGPDIAALRPAVGRDRGPGDPEQSGGRVSRGRGRARLRLDRGGGGVRNRRRPGRVPRRADRPAGFQGGAARQERLVAHSLGAHGLALSRRRRSEGCGKASSTPATWSCCAARATTSPEGAKA